MQALTTYAASHRRGCAGFEPWRTTPTSVATSSFPPTDVSSWSTAANADPPVASWVSRLSRRGALLGLLFALVVAVALFTRFSIDDHLSRDEAIFMYGGQQFVAGVPYYVSIFDAKTPLSPMIAGAGVEVSKVLGGSDVHAARVVFFLFACAAVMAVYLLALWLWGSVLAGVVSAAAFVSYKGFAIDALGGPDAKTPGVAFAAASMVLLVRRRWLSAGVMSALAFLCWQPLGIYMVVAVIAALVSAGDRRRACARSLVGVAIPVAGMFGYYWIAGALSDFIDAAFRFPLEGVKRVHTTVGERVSHIGTVVGDSYPALHGWLVWSGLVALIVLAALAIWQGRAAWRSVLSHPLISIVIASFVPLAAFTLSDVQNYPDLYPSLPYAALGLGGAAAVLVRCVRSRRAARAVATIGLTGAVVLCGFTWVAYSRARPDGVGLMIQRARADALTRILGARGTLYAIGDPVPLVLTHRRNPSRYIYLRSGVLQWMLAHTPGRYAGWRAQLLARDPSVIVVHDFTWRGPHLLAFDRFLGSRYETRWLGAWQVLVKAPLLRRAEAAGVVLNRVPG